MTLTHRLSVVSALTLAFILAPGAYAAEPGRADPQPHSDSLAAAASDTATTAKVKARLASDKRLGKSSISVKTTNGVVTLTGSAANSDASDAAEEVAKGVEGVKSVDNKISAPSGLEEAGGKVNRTAHEAREKVSDEWITTKIKSQLMSDRSVERGSDISVSTSDGVVRLSGSAKTQEALDHAKSVAHNVKGVKSVDTSELHLASSQ